MIKSKEKDVPANNLSPSDKYKTREIEKEEHSVVGLNGEPTTVCFLPVAEMPLKHIYGELDPLEGSPAREMTKRMEAGDLPLGEFMPPHIVAKQQKAKD